MTEVAAERRSPAHRIAALTVGGVVAAGWALSVASLAGLAGAMWWVFDLPANFRPQLGVAVLVPLGVVLGLRPVRRPAVAVFALAALVNLLVVWPYLGSGAAPVISGGAELDVVAYNVGISSPGRDEAMLWVRESDPDLVFLFESSFEWEDSVARVGLPLEVIVEVPATRLSGITVLARPDLEARPIPVPFDLARGSAVAVEAAGATVEVLGLHPVSPVTAGRAASRDDLLAAAGDWVAARNGPVLVVGDLNATPWSHAHRALVRRGGLTDSLRGRGLQPSWPVGWGAMMIPIDHALTSDGLAVIDRSTGPELGSTHLPLVVTVGVEEPP